MHRTEVQLGSLEGKNDTISPSTGLCSIKEPLLWKQSSIHTEHTIRSFQTILCFQDQSKTLKNEHGYCKACSHFQHYPLLGCPLWEDHLAPSPLLLFFTRPTPFPCFSIPFPLPSEDYTSTSHRSHFYRLPSSLGYHNIEDTSIQLYWENTSLYHLAEDCALQLIWSPERFFYNVTSWLLCAYYFL